MAVFKERGVLSEEFLYYLVDLYNENNDNFVKQGSILDQFKNPPSLWGALNVVGVLYSFSSRGAVKAETSAYPRVSIIMLVVRTGNVAIELYFDTHATKEYPKPLDLKFYSSILRKVYIKSCRYRVFTSDAKAEEDVMHLEMVR